jgi:hypothetical protein
MSERQNCEMRTVLRTSEAGRMKEEDEWVVNMITVVCIPV